MCRLSCADCERRSRLEERRLPELLMLLLLLLLLLFLLAIVNLPKSTVSTAHVLVEFC